MKHTVIKTLLCCLFTLLLLPAAAQPPHHGPGMPPPPREGKGGPKFNPQEFRRDFEKFVTKRAGLSEKDAKAFFPLFHEMKRQQRDIHGKIRRSMKRVGEKNLPEKDCQRILTEVFRLRKQNAELEQAYYAKFRKILSARDLLKVMEAEHQFGKERFKKGPKH